MTRSIGEALAAAAQGVGGDSPRADAEILLGHQLGLTRAQLFARAHEALSASDAVDYDKLLARRRRGEPVAYITGSKGFWTLELQVNPAVLVPRPETELLVEWALEWVAPAAAPRIADLGTGSGCIALALAAERPQAQITAVDVSAEALAVASGNAEQLGLSRVQFRQAGFAEFLNSAQTGFDLLVSNPPYIASGDTHLQQLRHEPLQALTDGADGLQCLREIIGHAGAALTAGGWLLLEHGHEQGAAVRALLNSAGFSAIETRRDLAGLERASAGRWR